MRIRGWAAASVCGEFGLLDDYVGWQLAAIDDVASRARRRRSSDWNAAAVLHGEVISDLQGSVSASLCLPGNSKFSRFRGQNDPIPLHRACFSFLRGSVGKG